MRDYHGLRHADTLVGMDLGSSLSVVLLSAAPVAELRGGIPLGLAVGLSPPLAVGLALFGNLAIVPILLWGLGWGESLLRRWPWAERRIDRIFARTRRKGAWVERFGALGLVLLVAIPLPGTGAWTGAIASFLLGVPRRRALLLISIGVVVAASLVTAASLGAIRLFGLETR